MWWPGLHFEHVTVATFGSLEARRVEVKGFTGQDSQKVGAGPTAVGWVVSGQWRGFESRRCPGSPCEYETPVYLGKVRCSALHVEYEGLTARLSGCAGGELRAQGVKLKRMGALSSSCCGGTSGLLAFTSYFINLREVLMTQDTAHAHSHRFRHVPASVTIPR